MILAPGEAARPNAESSEAEGVRAARTRGCIVKRNQAPSGAKDGRRDVSPDATMQAAGARFRLRRLPAALGAAIPSRDCIIPFHPLTLRSHDHARRTEALSNGLQEHTTMSFDVFLQRFVGGKPVEVDRQPVSSVLQTTQFQGPDEFGFYLVQFSDGVHVEFSASGLDGSKDFGGCAFHIRGMSPALVRFIFDVAKAGDMMILATMDCCGPILVAPEQERELPREMLQALGDPVLCASSIDLENLLLCGYAGWRRYRDQVIGDGLE
jgi:hypothetical protein